MSGQALLEKETAYFETNLRTFRRKFQGEYLLIHGDVLVGHYADEADAVADGVRKCGNDPFLVRRPEDEEPILTLPAYTLGLL